MRRGIVAACDFCGTEHYRGPFRVNSKYKFCSQVCREKHTAATKPSLAERFWRRVAKDGPIPEVCADLGCCWEWTGSLSSTGYGQISNPIRGERPLTTHRLSYRLNIGPIPDGLFVCHRCDNPRCVRPEHLYLGTNSENLADARAHGIKVGQQRATHCRRGHLFESYQERQICWVCRDIVRRSKRTVA